MGIELVGSELRAETEGEAIKRASNEAPGELRAPTLDECSRRTYGGGKREGRWFEEQGR
jgi:hypothetical protein